MYNWVMFWIGRGNVCLFIDPVLIHAQVAEMEYRSIAILLSTILN